MVEGDIYSDGGSGRITAVEEEGANVTCTVKYSLTNTSEKGVQIQRITETPMPYKDVQTPTRALTTPEKPVVVETGNVRPEWAGWSVVQRLENGRKSRKHKKLGWLLDEDNRHEGKILSTNERRDCTLLYWSQLHTYRQGLAKERGCDVSMLYHHDGRSKHGAWGSRVTADSQKDIPKDPIK